MIALKRSTPLNLLSRLILLSQQAGRPASSMASTINTPGSGEATVPAEANHAAANGGLIKKHGTTQVSANSTSSFRFSLSDGRVSNNLVDI